MSRRRARDQGGNEYQTVLTFVSRVAHIYSVCSVALLLSALPPPEDTTIASIGGLCVCCCCCSFFRRFLRSNQSQPWVRWLVGNHKCARQPPFIEMQRQLTALVLFCCPAYYYCTFFKVGRADEELIRSRLSYCTTIRS